LPGDSPRIQSPPAEPVASLWLSEAQVGSIRYTPAMPRLTIRHAVHARRLALEHLEDRRVLAAGVTVITHGAQFSGGLPDWTVTMGQAILDRADGALTSRNVGSLFQHNPATDQWQTVGDAAWTNSNSQNDHIVLLYDWSDESATFADGWLEAAADNLFAGLLSVNNSLTGGLQGTSFFEAAVAGGEGGGQLDLHLIGHSRGAVLNSLVAARFDRYFGELTIDHVTTLDAHPASYMSDPGYVATNPGQNSRVFTYDNVRFADNYFQNDNSYEPIFTFDFDGVIANGAYNFQIPSPVLQNGGSSLEHSDIHSWYYGTITEPFAAEYAGFSGAGRNNDGDVSFPDTWWGASGIAPRGATGFSFTSIAGGSRAGLPITGAKIAPGAIATVFNGYLSLGDVGWQLHGGAGSGPLSGSDPYVELNSGGDDYFRRHNPLYFPKHTIAVEYDYWVNDNDPTPPDDQLQVLVGGFVIDTVSLGSATTDFVRNRRATYALPQGGVVAPLEFRILDGAGNGIESAVRFDNVELVIQPPAPNADFNGDGFVNGNDFLAWQRGLGTFVTATPSAGDADFDNNVAADDLAVWRGQFGAATATVAAEFVADEELVALAYAVTRPALLHSQPRRSARDLLDFTDRPLPALLRYHGVNGDGLEPATWVIELQESPHKPRRGPDLQALCDVTDGLFERLGA
jgi:hypothetical protein